MEKPVENQENPDIEKANNPEHQNNAERPANDNNEKLPEQEDRSDLQKRRWEILKERKKPDQSATEAVHDRVDETVQRNVEEEKISMERELLAEQLEKGGLKLTEQEIQALYEAWPELVNGVSPEFSKYLGKMMPRLAKVLEETARYKSEDNEYKGIEALSDFLGKEMKLVGKIKDQETRDQVISFISSTIDVDKVIADMKKQTTIEGATELIKVVPVFGPGIDMTEAAFGRTTSGEKLTGGDRVGRAAVGTTFMVLDVAGFVSGGTTTAARVGITALKAGKGAAEAGRAAKGAYKAAKASEKAGNAVSIASKGAKIGRSITRFAALARKTTKLKGISQTIFKVGKLVQKYPRLAGVLVKTYQLRSKYKTVKGRVGLARKSFKAVNRATKMPRKPDTPENDQDLAEAA